MTSKNLCNDVDLHKRVRVYDDKYHPTGSYELAGNSTRPPCVWSYLSTCCEAVTSPRQTGEMATMGSNPVADIGYTNGTRRFWAP